MGLTGLHDSQARVLAFYSLALTSISLSERPLCMKRGADPCRFRSVMVILLNAIFSLGFVLGLALMVDIV